MLSLEEMRKDLDEVTVDIERLENVVTNINLLITESGGEDRNFMKIDVLRYSSFLKDGKELKITIEQKINECLKLNE